MPTDAVQFTKKFAPRFDYELFNYNKSNIHSWSWNYRGCWPMWVSHFFFLSLSLFRAPHGKVFHFVQECYPVVCFVFFFFLDYPLRNNNTNTRRYVPFDYSLWTFKASVGSAAATTNWKLHFDADFVPSSSLSSVVWWLTPPFCSSTILCSLQMFLAPDWLVGWLVDRLIDWLIDD